QIAIDPNLPVRGDRKLVQTTLVSGSDRHAFNYVMHRAGRGWKATDILLEGYVSQAATKRSEFAATLASGGAKALVAKLNALSDSLLAG
ncbi:MAG: ABC transporter substrate-binding protein, partial [Alphaproteobacteria bacterium]|nr:ABC transporter substrate-binding protein [Alphaproteobacteria bacterium]